MELPPIRSKLKKEKPVVNAAKKPDNRISSADYQSWEKFDVEKACEQVDMADLGPPSLDSKHSEPDKLEKLKEEAQYEKQRGNTFVKQEKWDDAISCYNRAIELYQKDAIFYANRGLCYLKKDCLHQAEFDCTEALKLDPTYVKALQRRAAAREKLGSLRSASRDLTEVVKLEPHNGEALKQLEAIKLKMGTKGAKSKSSPNTTPTIESKTILDENKPKIVGTEIKLTSAEEDDTDGPKIVEIETKYTRVVKKEKINKLGNQPGVERVIPKAVDKWKDGTEDNAAVIDPIKKPPHARSKKQLKLIPIEEIEIGGAEHTGILANPTKVIELVGDELGKGDYQKEPDSTENKPKKETGGLNISIESGDCPKENAKEDSKSTKTLSTGKAALELNVNESNESSISPESEKLGTDLLVKENCNTLVNAERFVLPTNCVQFVTEWKSLKDKIDGRCSYLSIIEPMKLPTIFQNSLESDILSDILTVLAENPEKFRKKKVISYLKGLAGVKRFSALAMFLTSSDKKAIKELLEYCKASEGCSEEEVNDLKNKFEL